jgi:DNA-binding NtrC family response regulator
VSLIPGRANVHVTVLDETLEVSQRVREVLGPLGVQLGFTGAPQELEVAFAVSGPPDLLIVNMSPDLSGSAIAEHVRRARFNGRVVALVDQPNDPRATYVNGIERAECVRRPASTAQLDDLLRTLAAESLRSAVQASPGVGTAVPTFHGIVGKSKPMLKIFSIIEKVAAGDANVCVYGESGTGKELIARAVHYASARRDRPLVTLDCAAIPDGLMESQLFGHVKGAFTTAIEGRDGVFSLADTGTLFMDELCELGLPLQAKLLRVIQTREFSKVGGSKPIRSNVRLITATNKDLKKAVQVGEFREDLYYRVAVIMIKVPPLRERRDDIPPLVEHFLQKFSALYRKPIRTIVPAAMDRILASPWPGNVRQLQNFLEQAVVLAESDVLRERDLFIEEASRTAGSIAPSPPDFELGLPLREMERRYILRTLAHAGGNRTQAAKALGISLRCLQYKLRAYLDDGESLPVKSADSKERDATAPAMLNSWAR